MASEWTAWRTRPEWQVDAPASYQRESEAIKRHGDLKVLPGRCGLCGHEAGFEPCDAAGFREGLACSGCHCNARQRAAAMVFLDALPQHAQARAYATEQASPFYVALRRRLPRLSGSELLSGLLQRLRLSLWLLRQGMPALVRNGDVTRLRMADACLDGVISLDVLEHVPDYTTALREFARVLRPGGVLVLTIPFYDLDAQSVVIAKLDAQGQIEHLGEPEFHGDPLRGGIPCFHHFGWDLLDVMREAGFSDAVACRVQDPERGLPQGQWVLRAQR